MTNYVSNDVDIQSQNDEALKRVSSLFEKQSFEHFLFKLGLENKPDELGARVIPEFSLFTKINNGFVFCFESAWIAPDLLFKSLNEYLNDISDSIELTWFYDDGNNEGYLS